jgi:hypothetical protein
MDPRQGPDLLERFVETTARAVSTIERSVAVLEADKAHLTADREACNRRHTEVLAGLSGQIAKVQEGVVTVQATLDKHITQDDVRRAGWGGWQAVIVGLVTSLVGPVALLVLAYALSRMGAPVAQSAVEAIQSFGK